MRIVRNRFPSNARTRSWTNQSTIWTRTRCRWHVPKYKKIKKIKNVYTLQTREWVMVTVGNKQRDTTRPFDSVRVGWVLLLSSHYDCRMCLIDGGIRAKIQDSLILQSSWFGRASVNFFFDRCKNKKKYNEECICNIYTTNKVRV